MSRNRIVIKDNKVLPPRPLELGELDDLFTGLRNKYIFLLTFVSGRERNELLGIRRVHYADETRATKWHDDALAILQDGEQTPLVKEAIVELDNLLYIMTYKFEGEDIDEEEE